jgi:alpha-N-arabinofuranosidase
MHSIHAYTADKEFVPSLSPQATNTVNHLPNAFAPLAAERAIEICAPLIDMARISEDTTKRPKICFDEWNTWDPVSAPGDKGAEERYTVSDMLAMGVWCNVFIRQSAHVGMANIAQSVNVISPLMTTATGLVKQTTWWVCLLFAKYISICVGGHWGCMCAAGLMAGGRIPLGCRVRIVWGGWM